MNAVFKKKKRDTMSIMNLFKSRAAQRRACDELSRMSDRELSDLGIFRGDINAVVLGHRRPN